MKKKVPHVGEIWMDLDLSNQQLETTTKYLKTEYKN